MFEITTVEPIGNTSGNPASGTSDTTGKRARKGSVILTDRMCEKRVTGRTKIYDRKCPGLFVSITTKGVATFYFKFTDKSTGKQRPKWLGVYNPETFRVEHARTEVYALKTRLGNGEIIAESFRQQKAQAAKRGKTVDQVIAERVEWMKTEVLKRDGEMRPRIETWSNVESHLRRFVSPRLGKKLASEVTKNDIATLSNDIVAGQFGKPSISNARHMRRAASAMFAWAAEAGRDYVNASPCVNLPPLDEEHPRERTLSEAEIRTLWHGLDREDMPWCRKTRLAIKFALATMLRSGELLPIHRDELNEENGTVDIPARRVKKRRVINQPLSDLAQEILKEAMGNCDYAFLGRFGDAPLARSAMANALRGTTYCDGRVKSAGICDLLGLKAFTPHDLRRTGATMCGELGLSEAGIALCLDHQANKDENGKPLPAVTRKVYNRATLVHVAKKREVLDAWAVELRRIVGPGRMGRAATTSA
ncbi:site-specific integrase [Bradyrhizobium sp. SZCCHNR3003]|uniref:tyrosine-type recombinase/integrase n=1 Tax=Bradyrhizobium sp. SZCCHNR3003 TaxID=3057387 RepID=UPI0029169104|nr:site-specific integrase [Bradyrhizobium sp. SZCCHNR3003]